MSCGQKCSKKGIKIDKSILRIEIFQNFEFLLFISAHFTPRQMLSGTVCLILTDICDWSHADKKTVHYYFGIKTLFFIRFVWNLGYVNYGSRNRKPQNWEWFGPLVGYLWDFECKKSSRNPDKEPKAVRRLRRLTAKPLATYSEKFEVGISFSHILQVYSRSIFGQNHKKKSKCDAHY